MCELYWLTRVDFIVATAVMLLFASILVFIFTLIHWSLDGEMPDKVKCIKKYNCIIGVVSFIIVAFTPTKEDLLLIYGLGPTVDYIQDNEEVKELPDKCVEALNKWVDSLDDKE